MVQAVLSRSTTISDHQRGEADERPSQNNVEMFLQGEVKENLTECWFEINELKEYFRIAVKTLPKSHAERLKLFRQIIGYPIGKFVSIGEGKSSDA